VSRLASVDARALGVVDVAEQLVPPRQLVPVEERHLLRYQRCLLSHEGVVARIAIPRPRKRLVSFAGRAGGQVVGGDAQL